MSLVIPKAILGLFTWQRVAGCPGAAREEAAGSGLAQHCFHQSLWSEQVTGPAQIHGAEKKALRLDGRSLQSIVAAFASPCFLILSFNSNFLCCPQGSQDPVSGMVLQ